MTRQRLLLLVLYLSFISLGLPDSILGVAWPVLRFSFGQPLQAGGFLVSLTTIISVLSSLAAPWIMTRAGTGRIITVCAFMTACAMFGYALSPSWAALLAFTLLFGIGQGAVDTSVNAYMAHNYSSRHMNWVHACWGIGATGGPLIMSAALGLDFSWRAGYLAIGAIQCLLGLIFLRSLPLWPVAPVKAVQANKSVQALRGLRLRFAAAGGVLFYFLYPGVEFVAGFWGASYLIEKLGATPGLAGAAITFYWGALTAGRLLAGAFSTSYLNRNIIRFGLLLAGIGIGLVISAAGPYLCIVALGLIGLGLSSLYPTMMHDTPRRLGAGPADKVVGLQVGAALAGTALLPMLFGVLASRAGLAAFGPFMLLCGGLVLAAHEISWRCSLHEPEGSDE